MTRDIYESLEYDGRLYDEMRRIAIEKEDLQRKLKDKDKEIERLNNIIDELEKYLIEKFNKTQDVKYCDDLIKLKELKEGK